MSTHPGENRPALSGRAGRGRRGRSLQTLSTHRAFVLLLLAYLLTGLWLSYRLPAFTGPNEELHYEDAALLRRDLRLPDPAASTRMDERHQPPIYYTAAALAAWRHAEPLTDRDFPGNAFYLGTKRGNLNPKLHVNPETAPLLYSARLTSLAFGAMGVTATYVAALLFLPISTSSLIAALLAFSPAWLHMSATAANDLPAAAMSALVLLWTTVLIRDESHSFRDPGRPEPGSRRRDLKRCALWGFLFSMALMTKVNTVFLAVAFAPVCWQRLRTRGLGAAVQAGIASIVAFLPLAAAWVLFNQSRGLDATGVERSVPVDRLFTLRLPDIAYLDGHLWTLYRSVIMDWSRGDVGFGPDWVYGLIGLVLGLGALGWLRTATRASESTEAPVPGASKSAAGLASGSESKSGTAFADRDAIRLTAAMHLSWIFVFLLFYLAVKTLMLKETGFVTAEGRWILPLAPSVAWLVGGGLARWWHAGDVVGATKTISFREGLPALCVGLGSVAFTLWFAPQLYPRAHRIAADASLPADARPVGFEYGDGLVLEAVRAPEMTAGSDVEIALHWRLENDQSAEYAMSVILESESEGELEGYTQRWSLPGAGTSSTSNWRSGERYLDSTWTIEAPPAPWGTRLAKLVVLLADAGATDPDLKERPFPMGQADVRTPGGDYLEWPVVAEIPVRPASPPVPSGDALLEQQPVFGNAIQLIAVDLTSEPDGDFIVLWWKALAELDADLTVFFHGIDASGQQVAQVDGMPQAGHSPTSIWREGDVIADKRGFGGRLRDEGSPAFVRLGLYDLESGARLPAMLDGERLRDDAYELDYKSRPQRSVTKQERRAGPEIQELVLTPDLSYPAPSTSRTE